MRAFYTDVSGRTADLCLFLRSDETRLTVRDPAGHVIHRDTYRSWYAALDALRAAGSGWVNDLTSVPLA